MTMNTKKTKADIFELRKHYVELRLKGQNNKVASQNVDISEATGSRVWHLYLLGGYEALKPKKSGRKKGEKRKLSKEQEHKIKRLLLKSTPRELELGFHLWTRQAVCLAIEKKFSINLPVRTITDYLRRWKCCPTKPVKVVRDAKPKTYRSWLRREYPKLKSRAERQGFEIHWCDTNKVSTKRDISMISSINNVGEIRFLLYQGELTEELFVNFLSGLMEDGQAYILLIMYRKEVFPKADSLAMKGRGLANLKLHYLKKCWAS